MSSVVEWLTQIISIPTPSAVAATIKSVRFQIRRGMIPALLPLRRLRATPMRSARTEERMSPMPTKRPMIFHDCLFAASRAPRIRAASRICRHSPDSTLRQRPDIHTIMATEEPSRRSAQTARQSAADRPSRQVQPSAKVVQARKITLRAESVPLHEAPHHVCSLGWGTVIHGMGRTRSRRKPRAAMARGTYQEAGMQAAVSASQLMAAAANKAAVCGRNPTPVAKDTNTRHRAVGWACFSKGKREGGAVHDSCCAKAESLPFLNFGPDVFKR